MIPHRTCAFESRTVITFELASQIDLINNVRGSGISDLENAQNRCILCSIAIGRP